MTNDLSVSKSIKNQSLELLKMVNEKARCSQGDL